MFLFILFLLSKNFDYRYRLLTIYTELQLNLIMSQRCLNQHPITLIVLSCSCICIFAAILSPLVTMSFYLITSFKISLVCCTFKKNNRLTKKPVNCFLQDGARADKSL